MVRRKEKKRAKAVGMRVIADGIFRLSGISGEVTRDAMAVSLGSQPPRSADDKLTIQHALRSIADSVAAVLFKLVSKWLQCLSVSG